MQTVDSLLNAVKTRHGISSDYKLARFLKLTENTIANYRHGRSRPDDKTLARLAELGNIDPAEIDLLAAQLQAERATNEDAKQLWLRIAGRLQAGAVHAVLMLCLAIVSLAGFAPNAEATALSHDKSASQSVYYVKLLTLRFFRTLRRSIRAKFQRFVQGISHVQSADTDAAHPHFA